MYLSTESFTTAAGAAAAAATAAADLASAACFLFSFCLHTAKYDTRTQDIPNPHNTRRAQGRHIQKSHRKRRIAQNSLG